MLCFACFGTGVDLCFACLDVLRWGMGMGGGVGGEKGKKGGRKEERGRWYTDIHCHKSQVHGRNNVIILQCQIFHYRLPWPEHLRW